LIISAFLVWFSFRQENSFILIIHYFFVFLVACMLSAAHNGDVELLNALLASGHAINEGNFDSVTALHEACLAGRPDTVYFLLQRGANVCLNFLSYMFCSSECADSGK
jgi:ankyrin repeat protein